MHRQHLIPLAFLLVVAFAALPAAAVEAEERFDQTYDLGAGGSVAVSNVNGYVRIDAWDRDEVRVEALAKTKAGSRDAAEEALAAIVIDVDHQGDHLEIETELPRRGIGLFDWLFGNDVHGSVSYRITVPRETDVEIDTVNGKVRVVGVAGRVDAATTNGGIEMTGVRGSVSAATTNGGIQVTLAEVAAGRDMRFSTTNGAIRLDLPRDVRASIDADTTNGGIDVEGFPADVRRRSRRHLEADLNGGGPEIRSSTTNGGIRISGGS